MGRNIEPASHRAKVYDKTSGQMPKIVRGDSKHAPWAKSSLVRRQNQTHIKMDVYVSERSGDDYKQIVAELKAEIDARGISRHEYLETRENDDARRPDMIIIVLDPATDRTSHPHYRRLSGQDFSSEIRLVDLQSFAYSSLGQRIPECGLPVPPIILHQDKDLVEGLGKRLLALDKQWPKAQVGAFRPRPLPVLPSSNPPINANGSSTNNILPHQLNVPRPSRVFNNAEIHSRCPILPYQANINGPSNPRDTTITSRNDIILPFPLNVPNGPGPSNPAYIANNVSNPTIPPQANFAGPSNFDAERMDSSGDWRMFGASPRSEESNRFREVILRRSARIQKKRDMNRHHIPKVLKKTAENVRLHEFIEKMERWTGRVEEIISSSPVVLPSPNHQTRSVNGEFLYTPINRNPNLLTPYGQSHRATSERPGCFEGNISFRNNYLQFALLPEDQKREALLWLAFWTEARRRIEGRPEPDFGLASEVSYVFPESEYESQVLER